MLPGILLTHGQLWTFLVLTGPIFFSFRNKEPETFRETFFILRDQLEEKKKAERWFVDESNKFFAIKLRESTESRSRERRQWRRRWRRRRRRRQLEFKLCRGNNWKTRQLIGKSHLLVFNLFRFLFNLLTMTTTTTATTMTTTRAKNLGHNPAREFLLFVSVAGDDYLHCSQAWTKKAP